MANVIYKKLNKLNHISAFRFSVYIDKNKGHIKLFKMQFLTKSKEIYQNLVATVIFCDSLKYIKKPLKYNGYNKPYSERENQVR